MAVLSAVVAAAATPACWQRHPNILAIATPYFLECLRRTREKVCESCHVQLSPASNFGHVSMFPPLYWCVDVDIIPPVLETSANLNFYCHRSQPHAPSGTSVFLHATYNHNLPLRIIQVGWYLCSPHGFQDQRVHAPSDHHSMVGMSSKSPFLSSFVAGIVAVVVVGILTFAVIFSWRYFGGRRRPEPSNNAIPLTTLEDGLKVSDTLDFASRSPSRLGDISPSSAERADEASEPQRQVFTQSGMADNSQVDGQHPVSGVSPQTPAYVVNPLTEGVEQVEEEHTKRGEDTSNFATSGNDSDMSPEHGPPRLSGFPSPPGIPPFPSVPPPPSRLSISTVWSQESMWPREKKPDVPAVPLPPLAHIPVTRRVILPTIAGSGSRHRGSASSFPRSVGQSDFEDYI